MLTSGGNHCPDKKRIFKGDKVIRAEWLAIIGLYFHLGKHVHKFMRAVKESARKTIIKISGTKGRFAKSGLFK